MSVLLMVLLLILAGRLISSSFETTKLFSSLMKLAGGSVLVVSACAVSWSDEPELELDDTTIVARRWRGSCELRTRFVYGSQATVEVAGSHRYAITRAVASEGLFVWVLMIDKLEPDDEYFFVFTERPEEYDMLCKAEP